MEYEQLKSALANDTSADAVNVLRSFDKCVRTLQRRLSCGIPIEAGEVGDLEDAVDALQDMLSRR